MKKDLHFTHGTTVVGERGQIVIPQTIREELSLEPGDEMVVFAHEGKVIVLPSAALTQFFASIVKTVPAKKKKAAPRRTKKVTAKKKANSKAKKRRS